LNWISAEQEQETGIFSHWEKVLFVGKYVLLSISGRTERERERERERDYSRIFLHPPSSVLSWVETVPLSFKSRHALEFNSWQGERYTNRAIKPLLHRNLEAEANKQTTSL
jgi:hypothetical protein